MPSLLNRQPLVARPVTPERVRETMGERGATRARALPWQSRRSQRATTRGDGRRCRRHGSRLRAVSASMRRSRARARKSMVMAGLLRWTGAVLAADTAGSPPRPCSSRRTGHGPAGRRLARLTIGRAPPVRSERPLRYPGSNENGARQGPVMFHAPKGQKAQPFFRTFWPRASAICTAFSAAPLRRLSDTHQKFRPFSIVESWRIRLMKVAKSPTHSTGVT